MTDTAALLLLLLLLTADGFAGGVEFLARCQSSWTSSAQTPTASAAGMGTRPRCHENPMEQQPGSVIGALHPLIYSSPNRMIGVFW